MLLALARLDDNVSPPDRLLSAFIRAATPPIDPKPPRDMLQFFRRDAIRQSRMRLYAAAC